MSITAIERFIGKLREFATGGVYIGYVRWDQVRDCLAVMAEREQPSPCPQPTDDALADAICNELTAASVGDCIRNPEAWYVELGKAQQIVREACK